MKSFLSLRSVNSLRSFLKRIPNKIYSVEIKIKSQDAKKPMVLSLNNSESDISNRSEQLIKNPPKIIAENVSTKKNSNSASSFKILENSADYLSHKEIIEKSSRMASSLKINSTSSSFNELISLNILLKELFHHLRKYPEASNLMIRKNVISKLIKIRELSQRSGSSKYETLLKTSTQKNLVTRSPYRALNENSRLVLSLLGYTDPPKGQGIKILSIDGGGTRGIAVIEVLRQIEQQCQKPIHKIFDLICGVSTGAIIAMLLGALRISIDECEEYYRKVSSHLFNTDIIRGTGRLLWSHAYYDTAVFEKILQEIYGDTVLIDSRKHPSCPHLVTISAIVNLPTLQPYLFRNYELHPSSKPLSHFEGSSSHKIWEAVRASAAAPGYFEEFTIGKHVHQDGGIILNNPTAVAVHEAKLLWPQERIQCVVSLGSGRYQPFTNTFESNETIATLSSLKHKLLRLIDAATDTEMIHRLMLDLLPPNTYHRVNPVLRDQANIDENRSEKLEQMKQDAQMYLRKNEHRFKTAIEQLKIKRSLSKTLTDEIQLKWKTLL